MDCGWLEGVDWRPQGCGMGTQCKALSGSGTQWAEWGQKPKKFRRRTAVCWRTMLPDNKNWGHEPRACEGKLWLRAQGPGTVGLGQKDPAKLKWVKAKKPQPST